MIRCTLVGGVVALIAWAYWPGLQGPFQFDDYANLNVLGAYGRLNNWAAFLYFLSSGIADPTGRPIALLTFLLDANTWPAASWPFKRTNLVIHLVNTGLLAWVITRLQAGLERRHHKFTTAPWAPLAAAALWGAHPFFVSTALYVVQREAMLPMTFVLLAVLAWDRAQQDFERQQLLKGWIWAVAGFGGASLLAGLSKANGFLSPLLVGLAYLGCLRVHTSGTDARTRIADKAAWFCLGLPSLLLLIYLMHAGWTLWAVPRIPGREWTLPQRLLSEPRAIWTYVWRLVLPRAGGGGLYVDDFATSQGWLDPITTLPAVLALLASAIAAIKFRKLYPVASFAWLFFLGAHLMESSTIPLELYFEHRNYLPACFLGWPLAHTLLRPGSHAKWRATLVIVILCGLLLLTRQRALVWGNEALFDVLSAKDQTDSSRSQVAAAKNEMQRGDLRAGLLRIVTMQRQHPNSVDIAINAISFECEGTDALATDTLARARWTLAHASNWNYGLYEWMQDASRDSEMRRCKGFGLTGLSKLVASAESNPQNTPPARKRDLWHVRGRIALAEGRPDLALQWFNAALSLKPDAEYALVQAAALGEAGAQAQGVQHLDYYARINASNPTPEVRDMPSAHVWLLRHYGYYDNELSSLRMRLEADETTPPSNKTLH